MSGPIRGGITAGRNGSRTSRAASTSCSRGRFNADVLYFAGECAPNGAPHEPDLKSKGYDYDSCGMDAFAHATVERGKIVLASGMTYRLLVLPDTTFMTPALVGRLSSLVHDGAVVVGPGATNSPTFKGFPADDTAIKTLTTAFWKTADPADKTPPAKGIAMSGISPEQMLARMGVAPDMSFKSAEGAAAVWIHRTVGDTDIYFVSNQKPRSADIECSCRISGKTPELWHPETGQIEAAPLWHAEKDRTAVTTRFDPAGSVFIVFRPVKETKHAVAVRGPQDAAAPRAPKIEITKARYEAIDGAGGVDVTTKVVAMVGTGSTEIPASNGAFGDPTYNHVKRLHIEYTLDGKAVTVDIPENGKLMLVEPGPDKPASYELASTPGSGVELRAFLKGDYEVRTSDGAVHKVNVASLPAPVDITGPWTVAFQPGRGAPASVQLAALASWTTNTDAGVKYFSGTATYEKDFDLPASAVGTDAKNQHPLMLDLGSVHEIAECSLNGTKLRTLWKPPYTVDITGVAAAGKNHLTVKITNLWANRLIGDEQFPEDEQWARGAPSPLKAWPDWFAPSASSASATLANRPTKDRLTFTTWKHWKKDSPLLESGLIGPVVVRAGERLQVTDKN